MEQAIRSTSKETVNSDLYESCENLVQDSFTEKGRGQLTRYLQGETVIDWTVDEWASALHLT